MQSSQFAHDRRMFRFGTVIYIMNWELDKRVLRSIASPDPVWLICILYMFEIEEFPISQISFQYKFIESNSTETEFVWHVELTRRKPNIDRINVCAPITVRISTLTHTHTSSHPFALIVLTSKKEKKNISSVCEW